jgi:MFS transporter, SHS family, lactate transporter
MNWLAVAKRRRSPASAAIVTALTICLNVGAILGGFIFGPLSERIGRRRTIALAALLALPIIPLWAFSTTPLMLAAGAFLIQVAVQGAWATVPAHLNELSPPAARGTFPGFAYQLGNLFAAVNATLQTSLMKSHHNDYSFALALVCGVVAVVLALVAWFGPEAKGAVFHEHPPQHPQLVT